MDLREFTSQSKTTKPWLNIICNQLDANKITPTEIETNLITLDNQVGVPNAPINATNLWSNGIGNLSQTDDSGTTVTYATTAFVGDYLPRDGSLPMTGNLDLNSNSIININNLNTSGTVGIGKTGGAVCPLEVVGLIISSDDNGFSAKELFMDCAASGSSSLIQSYQQSVGVRDLNIVSKNLSLGTSNALSAGGGVGVVFVENALGSPFSDPVGGSLLYSESGDLKCRSSSGVITNISDAVISDGNPSVQGNFPQYMDSSGLLVGDSGLGVNLFRTLTAGLADLANLSDSVAPSGQSDLWQVPVGLTFNGGILNYIESTNTLYSTDSSNFSVGTQYSLDGGLTWAPCIFDIIPSVGMFITYNGTGLWLAIGNGSAIDFSYTSIDGVNFTSTGVIPPGSNKSTNLVFSSISNLFITGQNFDASHWISTSPDGIIWTDRITPDFTGLLNYTQIAKNSTTLVLVGDSPQINPIYSIDGGITWISGSGSLFATQAITWSETKGEFISMGGSSNVIRSSDGILWENVGSGGFGPTVSLIWVDFPIARYYCSYTGPDGFYNMASTIDSHLPFIQGHLDGSIVESQTYGSVIYIQQYDRFILSLDNQGIAYSTARPLIIKAMNNDMSIYPQYGTNANGSVLSNTVIETSLFSTGAGSLIIPANSMNLGSVSKLKFSIFLTSLQVGSNVIIRLRGNGSQLWQSPILAGPLVNTVLIGEIELTNVDNANPLISSIFYQDGLVPVLTSTSIALDYTVNDTFDLTAQFSVANPANQIQLNSSNLTLIKF